MFNSSSAALCPGPGNATNDAGGAAVDNIYNEAITGQLRSPADGTTKSIPIKNLLPLAINVFSVLHSGRITRAGTAAPGASAGFNVYFPGYVIITAQASGGFVTAFNAETTEFKVTPFLLSQSNDIGPLPEPSQERPVPSNSPRVVVGIGKTPKGTVLREQFWSLQADSVVLAPSEKRVCSISETNGIQQTSSESKTFSSELGANIGVSWGPVSSSVSASVSESSSFLQQVVLSHETSRMDTVELHNVSDHVQMYLRWQLIEVLTLLDVATGSSAIAAAVSALRPVLVKAYDLSNLKSEPQLTINLPTHPDVERYARGDATPVERATGV